ncbi:flagellar biosynthesis protein FlgD [Rhodobacteraceae bacterium CH30]|nr:flagellar biosynthesis protein FlgD [Rhodobacteraceae bacterium CH30]
MAISGVTVDERNTGGPKGEAPVAKAAGQALGDADMFMTLLMAQIKNQDPLSPSDPAQFVNQLVQMNQMQTSLSMLSELKGNALMMRELQGLALGGQVGHLSRVSTDMLELSGASGPLSGHLTLPAAEKAVSVTLTAADGSQTKVDLGAQPEGAFAFSIDPAALKLPAGRYEVSVQTASGKKPMLEFEARIEGVRLPVSGGEPLLRLAGLGEFPASSITQLRGSATRDAQG